MQTITVPRTIAGTGTAICAGGTTEDSDGADRRRDTRREDTDRTLATVSRSGFAGEDAPNPSRVEKDGEASTRRCSTTIWWWTRPSVAVLSHPGVAVQELARCCAISRFSRRSSSWARAPRSSISTACLRPRPADRGGTVAITRRAEQLFRRQRLIGISSPVSRIRRQSSAVDGRPVGDGIPRTAT